MIGGVNLGAVAMGFVLLAALLALGAVLVAMAAVVAALAWRIVAEVVDEVRGRR